MVSPNRTKLFRDMLTKTPFIETRKYKIFYTKFKKVLSWV